MKKSKIIVPALGILVLSTAASITGTVAWFTAQSRFETEVSEFAVVKTNNDLKCVQTAGLGTSVTDNVVSTLANYELTDSSLDHANQMIIAPDAAGEKVGKKVAVGSATADTNASTGIQRAAYTVSTTNHVVLSAMTWTMTFSMQFGAVPGNYGLYFDASTSKTQKWSEGAWTDTFASTDTGVGFRIALLGQDATYTQKKVWADRQANPQYVSNSLAVGATLAGSDYGTYDIMNSSYAAGVPASEQATSAALETNNYLGKFVYNENQTVSLVYTVVAWFEGTDSTITNDATVFDKVKAIMNFEVKKLTD